MTTPDPAIEAVKDRFLIEIGEAKLDPHAADPIASAIRIITAYETALWSRDMEAAPMETPIFLECIESGMVYGLIDDETHGVFRPGESQDYVGPLSDFKRWRPLPALPEEG